MMFRVADKDKNPVILTKTTWQKKLLHPVFGHPEVKSFRNQMKQTIQDPDYIHQSIRDSRSKLFFSKIERGIFTSYYLCVVVKYVLEDQKTIGYISTVMINRKLPK